MRDFCICMLSFCILVLTIGHCIQEVMIVNLRQSVKRIEQGYEEVLAENQKMERMNDQVLRLMTEGGWDGTISMGADY